MGAVSALAAVGVMLTAQPALASGLLQRRTQDPERLAPFGLMLDASAPEGAGLSLSFRPTRMVRLHVGGTHNGVRPGARLGLTLLPWKGSLTPALTLEAGHARPANGEGLERRIVDRTQMPIHSFERVGYSYASALLGFEWQAPRRLTFFVRGGVSIMRLYSPGIEGVDEQFREALEPADFHGWSFIDIQPTAKLGILLSFG
ncbi:hypothetical protein [Myxococcus sp. Y35]|uniref:hypothetical protein n=1 Tax=Pseudomyxococcus flavus TaxID=3115648 RepID=UPI003CEF03AA